MGLTSVPSIVIIIIISIINTIIIIIIIIVIIMIFYCSSISRVESIEILPCHVTAPRRYSGQHDMKLRELGPYAYDHNDTTQSWEGSDYNVDSSFEPWA